MAVWLPHNGMMPIFLGKILREVEINKKEKERKKKKKQTAKTLSTLMT